MTEFGKRGSKFVSQHGYVLICPVTGHKLWWWDHDKWLEEQQSYTSEFWDKYRELKKGDPHCAIVQEVKRHFQAKSKWDRMALNAPTQGRFVP